MQKYHLQKNIKPMENTQKEQREDVLYQAQGGDSVMIMRSVRGGQKINVRGNAVIMGDINPGGEVMASGSIIVMGSCRGLLHAGAEGDTDAFVVAYVLAAQQVRIADHVATVPQELAESPLKAAMIKGDTIVVTDYFPSQFKSVRLAQ
jgi:septum site-determining protein MinC